MCAHLNFHRRRRHPLAHSPFASGPRQLLSPATVCRRPLSHAGRCRRPLSSAGWPQRRITQIKNSLYRPQLIFQLGLWPDCLKLRSMPAWHHSSGEGDEAQAFLTGAAFTGAALAGAAGAAALGAAGAAASGAGAALTGAAFVSTGFALPSVTRSLFCDD